MSDSEREFLSALARLEIERLTKLSGPIVRVCGPLTADGPEGYQRNANRLTGAESILEEKGFTVWRFADSEHYIQGKNLDHDDIITYFHKPLLESGLFEAAYFLPRWEESNGASREHELCQEHKITIKEFPEEWFVSNEQSKEFKPKIT